MGQKVHPIGIRLGVVKRHNANWYASPKQYAEYLLKDLQVREFLTKKLKNAMISNILIERPTGAAKVTISTARPGIVIGKKGEDIEKLQRELTQIMGIPAQVSINEIDRPDLDARLVAEAIASQLEKRVMFRRAMKRAVQNTMRAGAKGIKVEVSGRLGGAEIARTEWYREGRVPLHTLRADIDYSTMRAETTYGTIGVKVWIFRGEILGGMKQVMNPAPAEERPAKRGRGRGEGQERRGRRNDRNDRGPGRGGPRGRSGKWRADGPDGERGRGSGRFSNDRDGRRYSGDRDGGGGERTITSSVAPREHFWSTFCNT